MFVERDGTGAIKGVYANRQPGYAEEELRDDDPAVIAYRAAVDSLDVVDVTQFKIAFNHENRIRALEAKAPLTLAQFKTALRALLG